MVTPIYQSIVALVLAAAALAHADEPAPAVQTFQEIRAALVGAKKGGDWNAFLTNARRQSEFLNGSPTSHLEIARAQMQLSRTAEASEEVRIFLAMGQVNPILDTPLFAVLKKSFTEHIAENRSPVSRASVEITLAASSLLPEDIDFDAKTKRFFVTSVLKQAVFSVDRSGATVIFAPSASHWPMLGIKVDSKRRRLWATEVAIEGFTSVPSSDWGRSALLEFDLGSGKLLSRVEGPAHTALGDMVLARDGGPILSDGTGGGIYRLRAGKLQRIDRGDFISPQTAAMCEDGRVFVPDYVRGIASFEPDTGAVKWFAMQNRFALSGADGLYCRGGSLIAVQNGTVPSRVVEFELDAKRTSIVAESVIERSTPTLGEPTHGVFAEGAFFYIANSGWGALDEHGVPVSSMSPALIMRSKESP